MLRHVAPSCLLLLVSACPADPGTSTGSDTGTGDGTSTTATGTSGGSSTGALPTTGAVTTGAATTGAATTGDATTGDATTGDATTGDATTGAAACEDIVGSMDCPALVAVSGDLTLAQCMLCQGAPCGQEVECDGLFPCVDDSIVLRGCCSDDQCAGLAPFCGMFIGTNNVCVPSDDDV